MSLNEVFYYFIFMSSVFRLQVSDEVGFGRSLFERLSLMCHSKHLLNIQYRMHPSISFFPNLNFYRNQILNAQSVQSKSYEQSYLPGSMFGPYSFINVIGGKEEMDDIGYSRRNMVEVSVVTKIVHELYKGVHIFRKVLFTMFLYTCAYLFFITLSLGLLFDPKLFWVLKYKSKGTLYCGFFCCIHHRWEIYDCSTLGENFLVMNLPLKFSSFSMYKSLLV